jgi:LuxR family maltose regulon positive regulatory protein
VVTTPLGQLSEIRAHDIRFTQGEASHFFNQTMRLDLETETVAALAQHTERWIAGLLMVALSMCDLADVGGFAQIVGL